MEYVLTNCTLDHRPNRPPLAAKDFIPKGRIIFPAQLFALKREDLHEADESQTALRNILGFDNVVGQEELINYCYGQKQSELLLLPYSAVVNFINLKSRQEAQCRDSVACTINWLDLHPLDVLEMSGSLILAYVALRDILPCEEIVISYGQAWEDA